MAVEWRKMILLFDDYSKAVIFNTGSDDDFSIVNLCLQRLAGKKIGIKEAIARYC